MTEELLIHKLTYKQANVNKNSASASLKGVLTEKWRNTLQEAAPPSLLGRMLHFNKQNRALLYFICLILF